MGPVTSGLNLLFICNINIWLLLIEQLLRYRVPFCGLANAMKSIDCDIWFCRAEQLKQDNRNDCNFFLNIQLNKGVQKACLEDNSIKEEFLIQVFKPFFQKRKKNVSYLYNTNITMS